MKMEEIHRNLAILPPHWDQGPGSSVSMWETGGLFGHCRCQMMIKSVWIVQFWLNWEKSIENWKYCHCTGNRPPWVLNEQVGDTGLFLTFYRSEDGYIHIDIWFLIKLEEIHRNFAILPLHRESRALGLQRACERVKTIIGKVRLLLILHK